MMQPLSDRYCSIEPFHFISFVFDLYDEIIHSFRFIQLRYTGMLETVRIRRAGYNVRLTYEEFIQLYRILLPKGLISSQRDVRDFMDTMDLNKQHYQLGTTKIYMRESQKMSLDYKLHTKIIESIIMIQRWFKTRIQKEKFALYRSAAIKIQSFWRMHLAQMQLYRLKMQMNAVILIQSTFRMFRQRKLYRKLLHGIVVVQAHIRGKCARIRYKRTYRDRVLKERYKLRPTQSLPIDDRFSGCDVSTGIDMDISRSYPKLVQHDYMNPEHQRLVAKSMVMRSPGHEVVHRAEHQFRNLLISSSKSAGPEIVMRTPEIRSATASANTNEEVVDSRSPRAYNIDYATKQYFDDSFMSNRYVCVHVIRRLQSI